MSNFRKSLKYLVISVSLVVIPSISFAAWNTQLNKWDLFTPVIWNDFVVKLTSLISENTVINNRITTSSGSVVTFNSRIAAINASLTALNSGYTTYTTYLSTSTTNLSTIDTKINTLSWAVSGYIGTTYLNKFLPLTGWTFSGNLVAPNFALTTSSGWIHWSGWTFNFYWPVWWSINYWTWVSSTSYAISVNSGTLDSDMPIEFTNVWLNDEWNIGNGKSFTSNKDWLSVFGILGGWKIKTTFLWGDVTNYGNLTVNWSVTVDNDSIGNDKIIINWNNDAWLKQYKWTGENFGLAVSVGSTLATEWFKIKDLSLNDLFWIKWDNSWNFLLNTAKAKLYAGWSNDVVTPEISLKASDGWTNFYQTVFSLKPNSTDRYGYFYNPYNLAWVSWSNYYPIKFDSNFNWTTTTTPEVLVDGSLNLNGWYSTYLNGLTLSWSTILWKMSGDPTGINGSMYYNTTSNKFRCFENSAWKDCGGNTLDTSALIAYNWTDLNKYISWTSTGTICMGNSCTSTWILNDWSTSSKPAVSCYQLKIDYPSSTNGTYWINPGNAPTAFQVYCDMTTKWGGRTLVLKTDGSKTTFRYDSDYWYNKNNTLNESDTNTGKTLEYKSQAFNLLPFDQMMLVMDTAGTVNRATFDFLWTKSSADLFWGPSITTSLWRGSWKSLVPWSSLQTNCGREWTNLVTAFFNRVRLGIQWNNEADCWSNDSRLWIWMAGAWGWSNPNITSGNSARAAAGADNWDKDISSFAYLYVRNYIAPPAWAGNVATNYATTCNALKAQYSDTPSGEYRIKPNSDPAFLTYCDMTTDSGGWSLAAWINNGATIWDAYNVDNWTYWFASTFGYKISRFSGDVNWEDLEYMFMVDNVQKWQIFKWVNKEWTNSNNAANTAFDTSFTQRTVWTSTWNTCNASLYHNNAAWNWSISDNSWWNWCAGYNLWNWLIIHWNTPTEIAYYIYWLWTRAGTNSWSNFKIYVRERLKTTNDWLTLAKAWQSCASIIYDFPSSVNGTYYIKPTGVATAFQTYCDMTNWGRTLVGRGRWWWTFADAGQGTLTDLPTRFASPYTTSNNTNIVAVPSSYVNAIASANWSSWYNVWVNRLEAPGNDYYINWNGATFWSTIPTMSQTWKHQNGTVCANTNDTYTCMGSINDARRVFTFAWVSHNNQYWFSQWQTGPTWRQYTTEWHPLPYTEIWVK